MRKRIVAATLVLACLAALSAVASTASASSRLLIGIYDDAQVLYGNPARTFPLLRQARAQVVRVNLFWGGVTGVARRKPTRATHPDDPVYNWETYDRTVYWATQYGLRVVFSIYGTPQWANGNKGVNVPPTNMADLQNFAYAAAQRYSGRWKAKDGRVIPAVKNWLAWNEPNNPVFLKPQFKRVAGGWQIESARIYARICNAIYRGIKVTGFSGERVACGVTAPRGNNNPRASRPSVSPLPFLRAMKRYGAARFDAYAHHPYYGKPTEGPSTRPPAAKGAAPTAVTLGNIDALIRELTRLYGARRVWLTEYGYQTKPQDRVFGVPYATQARYLTEAFSIARRHPRIDMMLWFLLRDEPPFGIWQSGLLTSNWQKKPAFAAFQRLTR